MGRLNQGGYNSDRKKIEGELDKLKEKIYDGHKDITGWKIKRSRYINPGNYEYIDNEWRDIQQGEYWGGHEITAFFKTTIRLTPDYKGKKTVAQIITGGEGCIHINGIPYNGLDLNRNTVVLTECAGGDECYDVLIETYWKPGCIGVPHQIDPFFHKSIIAFENTAVRGLYFLAKTVYDAACFQGNEYIKYCMFDSVYQALLKVDYNIPRFADRINEAKIFLEEKLGEMKSGKIPFKMVFTGHSHIDVAWHWQIKETIRKCGRTFPSVLRLMEQHPSFKFTQSMPQLYEYTEDKTAGYKCNDFKGID